MPTRNPTRKWLCNWFLLMMSSNSLAQSNIDSMHRAAMENSPNVTVLERTVQTNQHRVLSEPCTAMIRDIITSTVEIADLQCETPSGMLYTIPGVDKAWIEAKHQNNELISGVTQIDLPPNTMIDEATQTLLLNSEPILITPKFSNRQENSNNRAIGTRTVLVVRVEATDAATSLSEAELANDIFGDGGDPNNLRSQYSACSFGKLDLTKAEGRTGISTNIQNGVVTLQIDLSVSVGEDVMLNAINTELLTQFSKSRANYLANHVVICLPPGVMMPASRIAFAQINGYRSVFNDDRCREVSTQIHEIGHNLNLHHSGKGNEEYGDKSCMMGYSYNHDDVPYMCFNAAKSWQLGWYSDKAITVRPTPQGFIDGRVELAGIADYGVTNKNVLIKIEQEQSPWAYFINYNLGKDMNRGTQMGKDKVLVTMKDTTREANLSELIAIINVGQHLQIRNFNDRAGEELTVRWESLSNDVTTIYIQLTGPSVPVPTESPSIAPSAVPSSRPSQAPSKTPSVGPSARPSHLPSQTPSMLPSVSPSVGPSHLPSQTPSTLPSVSPSVGPSHLPSQTPTMLASNNPSVGPSHLPSQTPSILPSISPSMTPSTPPSFISYSPSSSMYPSSVPSHSAAPTFSSAPSQAPSVLPSLTPSQTPSGLPSFSPSQVPSGLPSLLPSQTPSGLPSFTPSQVPSNEPSQSPSLRPSQGASLNPSQTPSQGPSLYPSQTPSQGPSLNPSQAPSQGPSLNPSQSPSLTPSFSPSQRPSKSPTATPSRSSSQGPSLDPSQGPSQPLSTESPSQTPSITPSTTPSAVSLELETKMTLQIPGNVGSSTILKMCDEVEAHLDSKLKEIYGPSSQTSVECRPDDPSVILGRRTLLLSGDRPMVDRIYANETVTRTKQVKLNNNNNITKTANEDNNTTKTVEEDNNNNNITNPIHVVENITIDQPVVEDNSNDDGEGGGTVVNVNVVATTFFPQRSAAPFQADFDSYVFHTIASDELNFLPKGYSLQSDDSSYPPVLRLAASSSAAVETSSAIVGYIISSSLTVILFLLF